MNLSYRSYRRYQANRYQYKVEQITAPIVMIFMIGLLTEYWWVIIAGIVILLLIRFRKKYSKKNAIMQIDNRASEDSIKENKRTTCQKGEVEIMNTTEAGYINKNNQKNNQKNSGRTDILGTDYGQWFYDMECLKCGHKYYANGSNIYEKKCPNCQGGKR